MPKKLREALRRATWRAKFAARPLIGATTVGALKFVRRFDPNKASNFAGALMRRVGPWLPEQKVGYANLKAAFPEKSPAEINEILGGVWESLGRSGAEFAHLDRLWDFDPERPEHSRIEVPQASRDCYFRLRDSGKPILVFAAHLGNWELPAIAAAVYGLPAAVFYRRPNIGDVDRFIREIRSVNMGKLIPDGFDAPIRMADALQAGHHVGMLVDQYWGRGVDVTFFGRTTKANPLIARLARQVECPIHGTRVVRLPGNRFRAELTEAIEPVRDREGKIDVAGTMQVITSIIEGWIREHPEQWLWLHRRWR